MVDQLTFSCNVIMRSIYLTILCWGKDCFGSQLCMRLTEKLKIFVEKNLLILILVKVYETDKVSQSLLYSASSTEG